MKKPVLFAVIGAGLLALVSFSGWKLLRRERSGPPPETEQVLFQSEISGAGQLIELRTSGEPIRTARWLRPMSGGIAIAQVLTQSNRQMIALFQDGKLSSNFTVPKPTGVGDSFFHFAELRDAAVLQDQLAVLLYKSPEGNVDLPLIVALDLSTKEIRWSHRAIGEHLVLSADQPKTAVFLFGAQSNVVRLPLALQRDEKANVRSLRSSAQIVELPVEVKDVAELLPTSGWTFLVTHGQGLSAYLGSKGWSHASAPGPSPLGFAEPKSTLAETAQTRWWQPEPGQLRSVKMDGSVIREMDLASLAPAAPFDKDAKLLQLLGGDAEGYLWFTLAAPTLTSPTNLEEPTKEPSKSESAQEESKANDGWTTETSTPKKENVLDSETKAVWDIYIQSGLDRMYRWKPGAKQLERVRLKELWPKFGAPMGMNVPTGDGGLRPSAKGFLLGSETRRWWLPLSALTQKETPKNSQ
jgi:hypothetical protein